MAATIDSFEGVIDRGKQILAQIAIANKKFEASPNVCLSYLCHAVNVMSPCHVAFPSTFAVSTFMISEHIFDLCRAWFDK